MELRLSRAPFGAAVVAAALCLSAAGRAATPASGTLTDTSGPISFTSGPFAASNPTPTPAVDSGPRCNSSANPCDSYELTVALPAGYAATHSNQRVKVTASWIPVGTDVDFWVYEGIVGDLDGSDPGLKNGATSANPEVAVLNLTDDLTKVYTIKVVPFAASGATVTTTVEIVTLDTPPPPPPGGPAGRHTTLMSPPGLGDDAGEPSVGYNLNSKRAMYIALTEVLKVTFPEYSGITDAAGDALPLSCDATWENVTFDTQGAATFDPILFTNQSLGAGQPGRTFASQLTLANSIYAFTDDDGANWTPGQLGSAPNGGVDHQTTGAGPYPPASATFAGAPPGNPGYAVYYCSQSIEDAFCARSDNGGLSFGPGMPMGKNSIFGCSPTDIGALHGHVRVSPNGDLAIPFKSCGGSQGFLHNADAGATWAAHKVPTSTSGNTDPQLAWSSNDAQGKTTGYFCFVDGDGKPKAAVTKDRGTTWGPVFEIGAQHNIKNAVFAQGIAGDPDRAACAFVGTTTGGNSDATDFTGIWHAYVAYTYDGGQTWNTVNVTPNDPVQGQGGICTAGTTCGSNRNLLDFNEMAIDEKGRVLFGYADGCITGACLSSGGENNDFEDKGAIARQIGGKSLFAAFDSEVPVVPQAPCLSGTRDPSKSVLRWKTPDDAGQTITGYNIYRATNVAGPYVQLATIPARNAYEDLTADSEVAEYFYKVAATFAGGEGAASNVLLLAITVGESVCTPPGLTQLTDTAGDATDQLPSHDVRALSISQPYYAGDYKLWLHLRMASLETMPENTVWPVNFCGPAFPCINPDVNTAAYGADNKWYTVRMTTVAPAGTASDPTFELFVPTEAGTTTGSRTRIVLAEGAGLSNFTTAGLITMVVNASDIGLTTAGAGSQKLSKFQTRIGANIVAGTITPDNMPNGLAGAGEYQTFALGFCAPNLAPLASLEASAQSGAAPLTVTFDAAASQDDDGSVANYSLDFGDGSAPVAQSGSAFTHTYTAAGNFPARLFVTDNRGLRSSNTAEKVIIVVPGPEPPGNNILGGALAPAGMLLLGLLGLLGLARRRRRR